jgi:hypothetical protein
VLGRRLARRGVMLSVAAFGLLPARALSAVAPSLVVTTVKAALTGAAGTAAAGLVSARVAALAEGVNRTMNFVKLKSVLLVCLALSVGLFGTGLGLRRVLADNPTQKKEKGDKSPGKEEKGKKPAGPTVNGTVKSVDAGKSAITVTVLVNPAKKQIEHKTFDLGKGVQIVLAHGLLKETKKGTLADVTPGMPVSLQLAADEKTVREVCVHGRSFHGDTVSVDAAKNTFTMNTFIMTSEETKKLVKWSFRLEKGARILLNDGLNRKKTDKPTLGKLSDLQEGTPVVVHTSGYDAKLAVGVVASGPTLYATLKGVDVGNNTITVRVKEDGQQVERTLKLAKGVRVDGGKLADLTTGTQVTVRLAVKDREKAVAIHVVEEQE